MEVRPFELGVAVMTVESNELPTFEEWIAQAGAELKHQREVRDIHVEDIADALGTSVRNVYFIERGNTKMLTHVYNYARALGIKMGVFCAIVDARMDAAKLTEAARRAGAKA